MNEDDNDERKGNKMIVNAAVESKGRFLIYYN